MSSVEVDDTDPRFDYKNNAWTSEEQSGEFDSTSHSSSIAGAQVTFGPFTGTSIAVFSTVGTEQTKLHFEVDGDQNLDLPAEVNPSIQFQKEVYSATSLDPTARHTLAINLLDAGPFTLDYVLIGGQSNTAILQSSAAALTTVSRTPISGTTTVPTPLPTKTQGSVGSSITSASISDTTSSFRALSASSTTSSSLFSSTAPMTSSPFPTGAGATMPLSGQSNLQPTSSGVSLGSETATPLGASSTSRPDAIVIGSVTAAIVSFAIIIVSMVLCLRCRRRAACRGRSVQDGELSTRRDSHLKQRPALQLNIPSSLPLPRSLQRPSLLPTHSSSSDLTTTATKRLAAFEVSHTTPSFLAEDPNDSPVFDIKQRPVSGSTMTTRVTVGTTIGQRVSVPESFYPYPYPHPESPAPMPIPVPPLPSLPPQAFNPSPTETGVSSATGSPSRFSLGFLDLDINQAGTFHTTDFSGSSENGAGAAGPGSPASRPLPHIPADTKHQTLANRETGRYAPRKQDHPHTPTYFPMSPSAEDSIIHQDGGVCLELNLQTRSRRELPPPYQDFGV